MSAQFIPMFLVFGVAFAALVIVACAAFLHAGFSPWGVAYQTPPQLDPSILQPPRTTELDVYTPTNHRAVTINQGEPND